MGRSRRVFNPNTDSRRCACSDDCQFRTWATFHRGHDAALIHRLIEEVIAHTKNEADAAQEIIERGGSVHLVTRFKKALWNNPRWEGPWNIPGSRIRVTHGTHKYWAIVVLEDDKLIARHWLGKRKCDHNPQTGEKL